VEARHLDLAHEFGRLCRSTAAGSDDPLAVEVGETTRAHDLLAAADFDLAAVVTDRAVDRLTELPVADGQLSVSGYSHLGAALVAARRGDEGTWQEHHAETEEAAHRLGDDHPGPVRVPGTALTLHLVTAPAVELARAAQVAPEVPSAT
jgi:hypothetical protein